MVSTVNVKSQASETDLNVEAAAQPLEFKSWLINFDRFFKT